jgi:hypothetical protein
MACATAACSGLITPSSAITESTRLRRSTARSRIASRVVETGTANHAHQQRLLVQTESSSGVSK